MNSQASQFWQDAPELAKFLLDSHNGHLTVAMPLGLGKANHLINALYDLVKANQRYSLKILTALTLQTPQPKSDLEQRFFAPIAERLYSGYTELHYARDMVANKLPNNVEVSEFFLQAGAYLNNSHSQAHYISANYSHASSYLLNKNVDVVLQMVAHNHTTQGQTSDLSLSCNPDITLELLAARSAGKTNFKLIAELNDDLPFMPHDAQLPVSEFAHILEGECASATLFSVPKQSVDLAEYAAGFYASSLIKDGGTLQIGIGSGGDAVAHALIMRHQNNRQYKQIMAALLKGHNDLDAQYLEPFEIGLYATSEMLVDVFLDLIESGVIKREVNDVLVHGGFFLGPSSMYQRLREMPDELRNKINMTHIGYINSTHTEFEHKQRNRQHARYINNAMKVTLTGAVVSDGLDNGQVVSGVGGQYDFVRQAFELANARSIIMVKARRESGGKQSSNIVWSYGHTTIPRHLRDIIISEYGVADVRGATDQEVVAALLSITDVEFQSELLDTAKANHKVAQDFSLKAQWQNNSHAHLEQLLKPFKEAGLLPSYPFGTDFTEIEQQLIPILLVLKSASKSRLGLLKLVLKGLIARKRPDHELALKRLNLHNAASVSEMLTKLAFLGALNQHESST